ncbi:MAG: guanylate kinase [Lachnospiraceae bacterium]|nr:guanylate kinase [Lachnospiraceae bacterium]
MGKIYVVMGKSASGKDTIYRRLVKDKALSLKTIVTYTTRPIRLGEENGREYYFVTEEEFERLKEEGHMIEARSYHTVHGIWHYFMADDGQIDIGKSDYIVIDTLEGYEQICAYYGKENVVPLYIEVEDGIRLERALSRERSQLEPKYAEMCRRFLADDADFSEDNIKHAAITKRYQNEEIEACYQELKQDILKNQV